MLTDSASLVQRPARTCSDVPPSGARGRGFPLCSVDQHSNSRAHDLDAPRTASLAMLAPPELCPPVRPWRPSTPKERDTGLLRAPCPVQEKTTTSWAEVSHHPLPVGQCKVWAMLLLETIRTSIGFSASTSQHHPESARSGPPLGGPPTREVQTPELPGGVSGEQVVGPTPEHTLSTACSAGVPVLSPIFARVCPLASAPAVHRLAWVAAASRS